VVTRSWRACHNPGDYVDIVPQGYPQTSGELAYFYTRDGSPGAMKTPASAGKYEVRYVMEAPQGRLILARVPLKAE
jgi:Ca-activated chloride channel family protein